MNKRHCDFCDIVLGDFTNGSSVWNSLSTAKSKWEYCTKHEKLVEDELNKLKIKLRNKLQTKSEILLTNTTKSDAV